MTDPHFTRPADLDRLLEENAALRRQNADLLLEFDRLRAEVPNLGMALLVKRIADGVESMAESIEEAMGHVIERFRVEEIERR